MRWLARGVLGILFREITLLGAHHLPTRGPVIVIANHTNSLIDGAILLGFLPRIPRFLAASTVWDYKPVAPFLDACGAVKIYRRQDGRAHQGALDDSFAEAAALLEVGGVLAVFPEGRTHDEPALLPFKTGTARIAHLAEARHGPLGLAVVPVGLTYEAKNRWRSRVCLSIGPPLSLAPPEADPEPAAPNAGPVQAAPSSAGHLRNPAPTALGEMRGTELGEAPRASPDTAPWRVREDAPGLAPGAARDTGIGADPAPLPAKPAAPLPSPSAAPPPVPRAAAPQAAPLSAPRSASPAPTPPGPVPPEAENPASASPARADTTRFQHALSAVAPDYLSPAEAAASALGGLLRAAPFNQIAPVDHPANKPSDQPADQLADRPSNKPADEPDVLPADPVTAPPAAAIDRPDAAVPDGLPATGFGASVARRPSPATLRAPGAPSAPAGAPSAPASATASAPASAPAGASPARVALDAYRAALDAAGLTDAALARPPGARQIARQALAALAGLPVALVAAWFNLPQGLLLRRLSRRQPRDRQMTWVVFGGVVLYPLSWAAWAACLGTIVGLGFGAVPGWATAAAICVIAPAAGRVAPATIDRLLWLRQTLAERRRLAGDPALHLRLLALRKQAQDAVTDPVEPPRKHG